MAFGQTDPARLEGSALRRWYLRSPGDLEDEQRRRAEYEHQQFYGGIHDLRELDSKSPGRFASHDGTAAPVQIAAQQARKPRATVGDCADCHGAWPSVPPPPGMLPPFGKLPIPRGFPTFRDVEGSMPSGPRNEGRKECEIQERRDRETCGRQPTPQDQAICHASATQRRAYCDLPNGTIGHPALDTAKLVGPVS